MDYIVYRKFAGTTVMVDRKPKLDEAIASARQCHENVNFPGRKPPFPIFVVHYNGVSEDSRTELFNSLN